MAADLVLRAILDDPASDDLNDLILHLEPDVVGGEPKIVAGVEQQRVDAVRPGRIAHAKVDLSSLDILKKTVR